jgi:RNA polymerase sigma-70 factor (ECF subfamily)
MIRTLQSFHTLPDDQLVAAYKETRNPAILGTLFKRHSHSIFGLCYSYLKNRHDSEDALMEIFETLGKKLENYNIQHFESWLYFVSRNYCLKKFQKKLRYKEEDISQISGDFFVEFEEDQNLNTERRLEVLSDAIDQLKDHQRKCVVLFYLENKSYKEIEAITPYTLKDIKSFIQNGKRNLKNNIAKLA